MAAGLGTVAAAVCILAVAAGGGSAAAASKVYSIYYSTPFIGNGWRTQAIDTTKAVLTHEPLKGKATVTIEVSAQNTPASQIASLNNIILKHPDAIMVEPSTPSALQGVIQQACNDHIVVTVFDSPLPNQCTYGWFENFVSIGKTQAEWVAKTLHGKGNIFQDQGLAGTLVAQQIVQGEDSVFKSYPGIKIIGKFYSQFAPGPEEQAVATLLAAHSGVNAVISEAYVTGTFTAFKNAHHAIVPIAGFAYNGPMVACATTKGATCFLASDPPYQAAYALRGAITLLQGGKQPHLSYLPTSCFTTNGTSVPGETCSKIAVGKNAFPSLSPELAAPVNPPWVTPPLTVKEATGT